MLSSAIELFEKRVTYLTGDSGSSFFSDFSLRPPVTSRGNFYSERDIAFKSFSLAFGFEFSVLLLFIGSD